MKGRVALLTGAAVGYVLGTRAGRERYEQIKTQARGIWQSPTVQEKASQAQDYAKQKAPEVRDKAVGAAAGAAAAAKERATGHGDANGSTPTSATTGLV